MRNAARGRARALDGTDLPRVFAGIETSVGAWSRTVADRLRRTTPRERILLGGLVLATLLYAPIATLEWRAVQEDRYTDAVTERSAARLSRDAARRVAAAAVDTSAIDDMRSWGFEGSNVSVLRVRIEQRLVEASTQAGLTDPEITVVEEIETIGPTQWLAAEVQADLLWRPTFAFLDNLTAWPEGFRVTEFRYETVPAPAAGMALTGQATSVGGGRVVIGLAFPVVAATPEAAS